MLRRTVAVLSLAVLAACGSHAANADPQAEADKVTQAVYNDDTATVTQDFTDDLKSQVTRTQVAQLSDRMHKLGDYKGLTFLSDDPTKDEFTYRGGFTNGTMDVVIRFNPEGKIAAYRVFPPSQ